MNPYTDLDGLSEIVLEDSYVLDVLAKPGELVLDVDVVLTRRHPAYAAPPPSEVECFRRGSLRFVGVRSLTWEDQGSPPATGASGETDYGHVDSFEWEDDRFLLSGDFGRLDLKAQALEVVLSTPEP